MSPISSCSSSWGKLIFHLLGARSTLRWWRAGKQLLFFFFPCNIHGRKVRNRGRKIIPIQILCMKMSIGFGALENLPLLPPSTQVSISIALLGLAKKIPLLCTIPFQPMIYSCLCSPKQQGAWPCPGVQWSWEGENGGEKGEFLVLGGLVLCLHGFYF